MKTTKILILILSLVAAKSLWAQITIMPLGDSITEGYDSSIPLEQRNGYRLELFNLLAASGHDVDFVGSLEDGTFAEKQHEGHGGWRDNEIADNVYRFLSDNPAEIILLHIGTNALDTSPDDVENILDNIDQWEIDNDQTAIVVLAKIINRENYTCGSFSTTTTFNRNVEKMVQSRTGDRIVIVDMECGADIDYRPSTLGGDMNDLLHPNGNGYEKMAAKWFADGLLTILPLADAGADQSADEKTLVTLDGSWSIDPDAPVGSPLEYWWAQQTGTMVELSDPTVPKPTFTAPEVGASGERLTFKLTVTDADNFEHSDYINIDVNNIYVQPVADAGSDQIVLENRTVTLDGSGLDPDHPDGMFSSVQWIQTSGQNQVTLLTPGELTTQFTAPEVDSGGDILTFKLTVKDSDDLTGLDTVTVTVKNGEPPVAKAGPDQSVLADNLVTLNGNGSYDPDGTISLVKWVQISGQAQAALTTTNALATDFVAPDVGPTGDVAIFKLMVTDNDGLVSEDTVTVTINPLPVVSDTSENGGGSGGGGCFIGTAVN